MILFCSFQTYYPFFRSLCNGFTNGCASIYVLFLFLFRTVFVDPKITPVLPSRGVHNKSISEGVAHCLYYGYHCDLPEISDYMQQHGYEPLQPRERRPRAERGHDIPELQLTQFRALLPIETGQRAKSRSRSPSPSQDLSVATIDMHAGEESGRNIPTVAEMARDPDRYRIYGRLYHNYMQPHTLDMSVVKNVYSEVQPAHKVVPLVVEVASRYNPRVSVRSCYEGNREQLFLQCTAAMNDEYPQIHGLLVVPDGMLLMRVALEDGVYKVYESRLVEWDDGDLPYLFARIKYIMQQ